MDRNAAARLYQTLVNRDPARAIATIESARESGASQAQLFDQLYAPAMSLLGAAWANGSIDEYIFAQAAVVADQVANFVTAPVSATDTGVTVLVGAMHHDRDSIDKNITAAALKEAGYRVIDLGVDVRPADFLERTEETGATIVLVFAQKVATATSVSRVREMFDAAERTDVVVLVSGGPFWADERLATAVGAAGTFKGAERALEAVGAAAAASVGERP